MTEPQTPQPYDEHGDTRPLPPPAHDWWATPAPQDSGVGQAPPPSLPVQEQRPRPRRRNAALLALAVLAAGATGGGVVALADDGSSTSPAASSVSRSSSVLQTSTSSSSSSSPAGTPESAASVIGPSIVTVEVTGTSTGTSGFGNSSSPVSDTGSGVVLRSDGYILTNNHVVAAAEGGGSVHVTLADGRTVAATIVGHDSTDDLAVLRANGVSGLTAATFANSDQLKVGQSVLAIGAPLGLSNTVTQGIVSTVHRPVATGEAGASAQSVIDAVQTDAAINPGNSGGALVDLAGRVVGINSAIASTGSSGGGQSGNIGVGFAIPSNDASKVADELIASGHATHSQIGVSAGDAASTTDGAPGLGAGVRAVTAGGPAAAAGLQAGDVITKVESRPVTDANSLIVAVRSHDPGSSVTITYTRGGATRTAKVTLRSAPSD